MTLAEVLAVLVIFLAGAVIGYLVAIRSVRARFVPGAGGRGGRPGVNGGRGEDGRPGRLEITFTKPDDL